MSLVLNQTKTALAPGLTASFLVSGGTGPYVYSVLAGGAGGSINSATGLYTAPIAVPAGSSTNAALLYDTIQATDSLAASTTSQILVGTPLLLFCEILQRELGLANGRVYIFDQKIFQPSDNGIYIAVAVPSCKPFSNNIKPAIISGVPDWSQSYQYTSFLAMLDINIISRDTSALNRKEEVILALNSIYAESQQEGNSFYIGKIPPNSGFRNLSMIDGAAIPYRYQISINMQYSVSKQKPVEYFDTFPEIQTATNP